MGGGTPPIPRPGRPAYAQPLPPEQQVPASMTFVTNRNRPQPLWQPPPPAASGAASEVPSPLMHPPPAAETKLDRSLGVSSIVHQSWLSPSWHRDHVMLQLYSPVPPVALHCSYTVHQTLCCSCTAPPKRRTDPTRVREGTPVFKMVAARTAQHPASAPPAKPPPPPPQNDAHPPRPQLPPP